MGSKIYQCNYHYFDTIDNEEKAYWLGFITADGNIQHIHKLRHLKTRDSWQDRYLLQLSIAETDVKHLQKFLFCINGNYPIKIYTNRTGFCESKYCRVIIEDKNLFDALVSHGITTQKSNNIKFPINLSESLQYAFIRGFFDGNGCISSSIIKGRPNYEINFCSTYEMLESIFNKLPASKKNFRPIQRYPERQVNNWTIRYGGNLQVETILNALYQNSTLNTRLDRKYNKYLSLKQYNGRSM